MGHETTGVVEAVRKEGWKVNKGDFVVRPFAYSDGTCEFRHEGPQTACVHGGFFGVGDEAGIRACANNSRPMNEGRKNTWSDAIDDGTCRNIVLAFSAT